MDNNQGNKLLDSLSKIGVYLIIFYILFLLGKSLWTNYQLKRMIDKLHSQIATLELQKKDLENLIVYYKSDAFKELEARKKLGYKRPDENVMVLPATPTPMNFPAEVEKEKQGVVVEKEEVKTANWLLWWEFFMK